ncbi:nucleotidyltransferase domain-containing protein [Mongoliitalea daihaiensis]|uniref:nucleotidyltransferase domain-containing protein n=1 Tax=Mongoliitalea daihaiensis TaxID=2782006 RepID=UPI001F3633C0|nr:nucleotidyltransferase domain-containing protein [Mongoliitalea daihaiensis]UJP63687.1 nucleotidyltransferase domain-containing protein [Mongoliitalea daihaiensis]
MKTKELEKFGLSHTTLEKINSVFGKYPEVEKVIVYGSRAKGNYRTGSDINLTLIGSDVTLDTLFAIEEDLDELFLPYTCDISIFSHLKNPDFLDHIERVGKVFYEK